MRKAKLTTSSPMTESCFIEYNGSRLHYVKAGRGKETLLFFHGFGQDHSVYVPLIQSLATHYQLYIFDLFFHGKSTWGHGENALEKKEWQAFMKLVLEKHTIGSFSVVGFSMGGKFALTTLELFAPGINRLFLIAPDGIRTSFWYSMATYPILLRKFFKGMISNYARFEKLARTLNKLKLADSGLVRFADYQMGTEEKRKRVYYSWVVFRHLSFDLRKIARLINENDVDTTIIVGRFDKVIMPQNMKKFVSMVKNGKLEILECGHSGLIYQTLPYLKP
jgi:pimeloyl-ACP methyl ester carboxylesterase